MKRFIAMAVMMLVVLFYFANTVYADAIWSTIYMRPVGLWVVPLTLLIEFPVVWAITNRSFTRCLIIDTVMNLASFIVGIFTLLPTLGFSAAGAGGWALVASFGISVATNTIVEGGVIMLIGRVPFSRDGMNILALVNAITTAIGIGAMFLGG